MHPWPNNLYRSGTSNTNNHQSAVLSPMEMAQISPKPNSMKNKNDETVFDDMSYNVRNIIRVPIWVH